MATWLGKHVIVSSRHVPATRFRRASAPEPRQFDRGEILCLPYRDWLDVSVSAGNHPLEQADLRSPARPVEVRRDNQQVDVAHIRLKLNHQKGAV